MRRITIGFIFVAVVVSGIFVLPNVAARFSGSHSMEVNTTNSLDDTPDFYKGTCFSYCHEKTDVLENFPRCTSCHVYILDELNATPTSRDVLASHTPPSLKDVNSPDSDVNYACIMCHHPPKIDFTGSHTKVGIVACTYCHGNSTDPGIFKSQIMGVDHDTSTNETAWVGLKLANPNDPHSGWFKALEKSDSIYPFNNTNTNFSAGFFACMACHTHLEMNMRLERPQSFNINMSMNSTTDEFDIVGPVINYSSPNLTYAQRPKGSVWS